MTAPALVASVALAGATAGMPNRFSVVQPGTGMGLVTTKAMFDAKLTFEAVAKMGTETDGVTIDSLALSAVDGGVAVEGEAHSTEGASPSTASCSPTTRVGPPAG